jgi:2-dehydro-3-deoxygluconokinase
MQNIKKIACIGEVMVELVTEGEDLARLNVAGDTYNTAVYLAQLLEGSGRQVSYVTALGKDKFSARALRHMESYGLTTDHIELRDDKVIGLYAIDTDLHGERSFTYWRSDSAARTLFAEPARIDLNSLMEFDLVFLSGITLAILPEETRQALFLALDRLRGSGRLVAYDSNYRPQLWASNSAARKVNEEMWVRTDIALPSVDDEIEIFGDPSGEAILERLRGYGLRHGAMKRGADGPVSLEDNARSSDWPAVGRVVDTTAAGDSFNAGFLAGIASGAQTLEAMTSGHALASRVIQYPGAIAPRSVIRESIAS